MIELELKREPRHPTKAVDAPCGQIDRLDLGLDKPYVTKNATDWIDDVAGIKVARGDFVQHWREQNEVLAVDQDNFCIPAASQRFVQIHSRAQSGKSAAQNDYLGLLHFASGKGLLS